MTSSSSQVLHDIVGVEGQRDPARYAVAGLSPAVAVAPSSTEEVAEVLRACNAEPLGCLVVGGMSRVSSCTTVERYDVALDTDRLQRFEHHTDDMMCTVGAGLRLDSVNQKLRARAQWLPWETEVIGPTTLGGAIATNCAGACEDGFGPPRRRVLELTAVTGLGEVIRVGAKVTKHSAGYAIHRLLCGSWGSLAVIAEATVMLAAMPGRKQYRVHLSDWQDALHMADTAEGLIPHLVSFTITSDADSLSACFDVTGDDRTLTRAATTIRTATTPPSSSGPYQSAIRFELDRSKANDFARSLRNLYPDATLRWRPISGVLWLLHSTPHQDYTSALALARECGATWRAERGRCLQRSTVSEAVRQIRLRVASALDPHRTLIGGSLRGDA